MVGSEPNGKRTDLLCFLQTTRSSVLRGVSGLFCLCFSDCLSRLSLLLVEVSRVSFSLCSLDCPRAPLSFFCFSDRLPRLSASILWIVLRVSLLLVEVSRGFSALLLGLSSHVSSLCFSDCLVCPSLLLFGSSLAPCSSVLRIVSRPFRLYPLDCCLVRPSFREVLPNGKRSRSTGR